MTILSSATRTVATSRESFCVYSEEWGQPPASHHLIQIQGDEGPEGEPQDGSIYVATGPIEAVKDAQLEAEFAAWERASDEALLGFEAGLG